MDGIQQGILGYNSVFIASMVLCFLVMCFHTSWKISSSSLEIGKPVLLRTEEKQIRKLSDSVESMGVVESLPDLQWETVEPKRIYKFSPKYFLTMGLRNTTINHITHIDKQYLFRLAARRKILQDHPNAIACLPSAVSMVNELYGYLISTHLPQRYPTIFQLKPTPASATHLLNKLTQDLLPLTPPSDPLQALRSLVTTIDGDFIMLLPCSSSSSSEEHAPFSLQAYIWCYPAGFQPSKLLGRSLAEIHGPVPGYASKLEKSIDRYFSRLEVGRVVTRTNWSIATTPRLWEDGLSGSHHLYADQDPPAAEEEEIDISQCYLRCELQTLFALPKSEARVLSLHLYMYPLQEIKEEEKRGERSAAGELCEAIDGLRRGNVPDMWRYKRAVVWGERVKEFLRS